MIGWPFDEEEEEAEGGKEAEGKAQKGAHCQQQSVNGGEEVLQTTTSTAQQYPPRSAYLFPSLSSEGNQKNPFTLRIKVVLDEDLRFLQRAVEQQLSDGVRHGSVINLDPWGDNEDNKMNNTNTTNTHSSSTKQPQQVAPKNFPSLIIVEKLTIASSIEFALEAIPPKRRAAGKGGGVRKNVDQQQHVDSSVLAPLDSLGIRLRVIVLNAQAWSGLLKANTLIDYVSDALSTVPKLTTTSSSITHGDKKGDGMKFLVYCCCHSSSRSGGSTVTQMIAACQIAFPNLLQFTMYETEEDLVNEVVRLAEYLHHAPKKKRDPFELDLKRSGFQNEIGAGVTAGKIAVDHRAGYRAMLAQIPQISLKRCNAVVGRFPSLQKLLTFLRSNSKDVVVRELENIHVLEERSILGSAVATSLYDFMTGTSSSAISPAAAFSQ